MKLKQTNQMESWQHNFQTVVSISLLRLEDVNSKPYIYMQISASNSKVLVSLTDLIAHFVLSAEERIWQLSQIQNLGIDIKVLNYGGFLTPEKRKRDVNTWMVTSGNTSKHNHQIVCYKLSSIQFVTKGRLYSKLNLEFVIILCKPPVFYQRHPYPVSL